MQLQNSCLLSFIAVIFLPQNCILLNSIKLESCRSLFNKNPNNFDCHSNYIPRQFITLLMHQNYTTHKNMEIIHLISVD